jgi:hypothetical protein
MNPTAGRAPTPQATPAAYVFQEASRVGAALASTVLDAANGWPVRRRRIYWRPRTFARSSTTQWSILG